MDFQRLAEQPDDGIEFHGADGVFVKQMHIKKAGSFVPQHSHTYDHLSMLAKGAVKVTVDGKLIGEFHAPAGINIAANTKHLFQTLKDDTIIYCIHNVSRMGEVEIHEEHQIVGG